MQTEQHQTQVRSSHLIDGIDPLELENPVGRAGLHDPTGKILAVLP
jgi:hypothetical protein